MRTRLGMCCGLVAAVLLAPDVGYSQAWPHSPVPVPPLASNLLPGKSAPQVTDIWVIFKTHCDLGYTMTFDAVNEKYRVPMMDNAIRLMEADRSKPAEQRFKWTIAGWPMAANILGPKQDPARKAKIEEGLREGAFVVHALPATIHSEAMDIEDYVRSLGFASKVARAYGKPLPISGKMTDVPGHAWIMPSLLAHAGIRFLQIGCNYSDRPLLLPQLFWWEGPDGSRILCNYTPHYGSDITPPKNWPAKNYLAVLMTHDNEGPPSPGEVAQVRDVVSKMPGVTLHLGTMDDFVRAIESEKPELPVVHGDMVDPWIHGISSMPVESSVARRIRPLEPVLDLLDTELKGWGIATADVAPTLAEAYEYSMLYGEHTFGAVTPGWGFFSEDGINRGPERFLYGAAFLNARANGFYKKFESSFDDKRAFIRRTEALVEKGLRERLDHLARSVDRSGDRVVVFNPLPWQRSGVVDIPGQPGATLFAEDVPPNGYKTFRASKIRSPERSKDLDSTVIKTAFYKVTFDLARGGISSLIEKSTGRELVDQSSPYALGQYLHETFSEAQTWDYYNRYCSMNNAAWGTVKPNMPKDAKYAAITPANWTAVVSKSPFRTIVTLTAGDTKNLAKGVSITFTFPTDKPTVEAGWRVDKKVGDPIPEGGWLCFPMAVQEPRFLVGRLGGPMDLAKDQILGGNRHLYGVNTGVALLAPDCAGIGLCALDAPTMSFGEPGLWKYTFDYLPKRPVVFVHLYNNMWNTNFPDWIEGSWMSRVRLWPIGKGTGDAIAIPAWEARVPLLAATASGAAGTLPREQAGLSLSRPGILVTAFGADPDGNKGTLLRLWNQTTEAGPVTVTLPLGFKASRAIPVNLRGERASTPVAVYKGQFKIELGSLAPASFIVE